MDWRKSSGPRTIAPSVVYVVDDDPVARKSAAYLISVLSVDVVSLATAEEFLATYRPESGGCLVLDVRMPGMSGIELQAEMLRRSIDIPIIFVSGHGNIPMAVRAVQAGALDFLPKPYSDQELLDRINQALQVDRERRHKRREEATLRARFELLTRREREILGLVVAGQTNKEIGQHLAISIKTVETHRARVMEKMRVDNLASLCAAYRTISLESPENPGLPVRVHVPP